jgi:hypothetical protein
VTFNRKFTYLGSVITDDLDDSVEINARIGKANDILYSLMSLWRSKGLTVRMKKSFYYIADHSEGISCSGDASPTLTIRKEALHRLELFHHSAIRCIFNISKLQQATARLRAMRD